ncbi:hypothetical protein OC834_006873 [Tilletia horrida]|uniref:Eukaryotic translation initiation factor 3 subunit D n=1 Tax=Tilletia horrida TaxID=155126 RepID=A0AAN6GFU8_9BASI|nr:hypothetical protein OC834_006873 [Tilletia horrida]KAK0530446.1 hypothetical protein OC835_004014 [Tilletia horrida]KAK0538292.1 hypothetical protein OC842_001355 [Tilletia horrida]KAK0550571.1 hypothetical protein OC844_006709 [Tilletia horrida]
MASFSLGHLSEQPDRWGPPESPATAADVLPSELRDIPFAPFLKTDKFGRIADWNADGRHLGNIFNSADPAAAAAAAVASGAGAAGGSGGGAGGSGGGKGAAGGAGAGAGAGGAAGGPAGRVGGRGGRGGDAASFGASGSNAFAYFHADDEASFSVVDSTRAASGTARLGGGGAGGGLGGGSGRGGAGGRGGRGGMGGAGGARGGGRGGMRGGRGGGLGGSGGLGGAGGHGAGFGSGARGGRRFGYKDWDKPQRTREASVSVQPDWQQLEEIDFARMTKLRLEVDEPEDLAAHGTLYEYDRSFDRINSVRFQQPLQALDRIRYNPTTSDDPIIQQIASSDATANVFMTDSILALLMSATRTVYPWDIILTRTADGKVYVDKRDGGAFDFVTVNENAADPPMELSEGKDEAPGATAAAKAAAAAAAAADKASAINTPSALSLEATYVSQNFASQVVKEKKKRTLAQGPNPFYNAEEETDPAASCGYRYRKFNLSSSEEDPVYVVVRTEVDAYTVPATPSSSSSSKKIQYITIKTLNEFDARAQGAGGAPDWRTKLDSQRGAVLATEMKNNSAKLARYTIQAILAGADNMKLGYISRANPRDASRHAILGTQWFKPKDFAAQMNLSLSNGFGIVRTLVDLVRKRAAEDGGGEAKYVLVKDPNKPLVKLYSVPLSWPEEDGGEDNDDEEGAGLGQREPLNAIDEE